MIDKKRLKELPKWAEDEIRRLQRDLEDAKKLLKSICGDKNSNTRICPFCGCDPSRGEVGIVLRQSAREVMDG